MRGAERVKGYALARFIIPRKSKFRLIVLSEIHDSVQKPKLHKTSWLGRHEGPSARGKAGDGAATIFCSRHCKSAGFHWAF